jgi:Protein of unknown function (DUF2934)
MFLIAVRNQISLGVASMPRAKQATSRKVSAENGNQVQTSAPAYASEFTGYEDEVRRRAYEIYESRGRQDGCAEEDWIRAEQELLAHSIKRTA